VLREGAKLLIDNSALGTIGKMASSVFPLFTAKPEDREEVCVNTFPL